MFHWFSHLLDTSGFPARWQCGAGWAEEPILGWLHVGSDLATFTAYYAVPCIVTWYVLKTPDIRAKFPLIFWVFLALVFFSCGTVHLLEAGIFWWPHYRLSALFKVLTAVVSLVGVAVLARSLPNALSLKTADELQTEIDERRQAEQQLQFEKKIVHTLMNHLPDAIYFKDLSGKYLRVSRSLARNLRLGDPMDAIGKSESDLLPDGSQREDFDREVLQTGEALIGHIEKAPWTVAGERWLSTSRLPLHGPDNKPMGTFGISHDITPIKRSEERLAVLAQQLALPRQTKPQDRQPIPFDRFCLQDMITCGSDIRAMGLQSSRTFDVERKIVDYLYQRMRTPSGEPALALVRMFQTIPFSQLDRELQQLARDACKGRELSPETRCLVLKGTAGVEPRWNDPIDSQNHRVIPLPSVSAVKQLPMILRLIQQFGIDAGALVEGRGKLLIEDTAANVFHVPVAIDSEFIPDQEQFVVPHEIKSVVGFGDVLPGGDLFAVICFSKVEIPAATAVLFSHLSISAKLALLATEPPGKRVEAQIQAVDTMLQNYETVVCDQEILLQQTMKDLEEARDAADKANHAKSDFLANMSHEIRTPMNAILGMTELVLEGDLTKSERDYLTTVLDSGESLLSIINEILDFSKIEAGKLDIHYAEFDVREQIGDMVRSLGIRAHRKGIELACQIDPDVPTHLVSDVARLRQVIVNLTGNSIKFTEQGEVVVYVEAVNVDEDQAEIRFRVTDTGIGIPPEMCENIFDAFSQADASTTRMHGGTGLGLTISATIVDRLGGKIEVQSQIGQGSEFYFTLVMQVGSGTSVFSRGSQSDLQGLPVLLVDDNDTNLHILEKMTQSFGMKPRGAHSGAEAIELLRDWSRTGNALPIVVTDVHMPEMDGYEFVDRIRRDSDIADAPVVVLTSGARSGDQKRCRQLGVVSHLLKPVKQTEMLEALLNAAGRKLLADPNDQGSSESLDHPSIPLKILVAEDGIANQKLAVGMLERWGHDVDVAENGEIAVQMQRKGRYDLILMDLQMPIMDGLDATRAIRNSESGTAQHVPIIAMTAHALVGDREKCIEAGMDHYLSKPIHKELLAEALEKFTHVDPSSDDVSSPELTPHSERSMADSNVASDQLDLSAALEVMEGQVEILVSVLEAFIEETPELIDQLEKAIESNDATTAQRAAHTIKGGFRILQMQPQMDRWSAVEKLAQDNKLSEIPSKLVETKSLTLRLLDQLRAFVAANR